MGRVTAVITLLLVCVSASAQSPAAPDTERLRGELLACILKLGHNPQAAASLSPMARANLEVIASELQARQVRQVASTGSGAGTLSLSSVQQNGGETVRFAVIAAAPAGKVVYRDEKLGGAYDDSWQTAWVPVDKQGPFGIVYRTWQCKTRALRHERHLRIYGPDVAEIRDRANTCFATAAVAGAISAVLSGGAGVDVATAAFTACMGANSGVEFSIDDDSHWTDWHDC